MSDGGVETGDGAVAKGPPDRFRSHPQTEGQVPPRAGPLMRYAGTTADATG